MQLLRRALRTGEAGQSMIFVGVMLPVMMGIMGLGIMGGKLYTEHQNLQSAADMAAIVGSQALPCATTDTSCITNAETLACQYATKNGYSSCTPGAATDTSANVPPISCSPYDFMDYGNGATNSHCKNASSPSYYSYIEVRLTSNLGTVPIFNTPVSITAHAVAKHGVPTGADFAIITLSSTVPFAMSGSNTTAVGGAVFANGGIQGNGASDSVACGGGWYSAQSVTGVSTYSNGTETYAPPGCTGTKDSTALTQQNLPQIQDPYAGSVPPPTMSGNGNPNSGTFPNCPECTNWGWWYDLSTHLWHWAGSGSKGDCSPSGNIELFPGKYCDLPNGNKGMAYFNPGVYTVTQGFDLTGGYMCVYGAPACSDTKGTCASSTFTPGTTAAASWYYSCSPYGFWDSTLSRTDALGHGPGTALPTTPPRWYNMDTGDYSSTPPLNGVTFYLPTNSGGIQNRGNAGPNYLAAPNPCAGTGSFQSGQVSFPAGHTSTSSTDGYQYPSGRPETDLFHGLPAYSQRQVYPNLDFSTLEEGQCNSPYLVWPGEMTHPQHAHFIFYIQGPGSDSFIRGTSNQNYFGVFYAPSSDLQFTGDSGGSGGPPWLTGQLVVGSASKWYGNSDVGVTYRPCAPGSNACGTGYSSQLVQ